MTDKPYSEAAARNSAPILDVLRSELAESSSVLEIGSGTGQHAAFFAAALPQLKWQTSDRVENHDGILAWVNSAGLENLLPPLELDVLTNTLPAASYDFVYSANTAHIMSIDAVEKMFDIVGSALIPGGTFCLYGPFRQAGKFNAPSNAAFHQSLRSQNADMGIRHLESLDAFGRDNKLTRTRLYAMPANNYIGIWQKESQ
jgi:SAM-dependent methyltransferase